MSSRVRIVLLHGGCRIEYVNLVQIDMIGDADAGGSPPAHASGCTVKIPRAFCPSPSFCPPLVPSTIWSRMPSSAAPRQLLRPRLAVVPGPIDVGRVEIVDPVLQGSRHNLAGGRLIHSPAPLAAGAQTNARYPKSRSTQLSVFHRSLPRCPTPTAAPADVRPIARRDPHSPTSHALSQTARYSVPCHPATTPAPAPRTRPCPRVDRIAPRHR